MRYTTVVILHVCHVFGCAAIVPDPHALRDAMQDESLLEGQVEDELFPGLDATIDAREDVGYSTDCLDASGSRGDDTQCIPACGTKECGPDGCGGKCRACGDPAQSCLEGTCCWNDPCCGSTCGLSAVS